MTFQEQIESVLHVTDRLLVEKLAKSARIRMVHKGELLQAVGEENRYIAFVIRGLFRGYYVNSDGGEVTDCFAYHPGNALVSCAGIDEPSTISIEALEDGEVLCIQTDVLMENIEHNQELSRLYNLFLKESLKMHWENKVALAKQKAASRYLWFQEHYPGLIDRVSHKHVASFLGMTPVSLSRVRKSMREG